MRNRADLTSALIRLGFDVLPSSANFVFARHPGHSGQALATALRERAVLVRQLATPRISDFLRITIGSESDLRRLTAAVSEILAETRSDQRDLGNRNIDICFCPSLASPVFAAHEAIAG